MFHRLGKLSAGYPWIVCPAWILIGIILSYLAPHWDTTTQDDDINFIPDRYTSVHHRLMEKAFKKEVEASRLVVAVEREDGPLNSSDFAVVDQIVKEIEAFRDGSAEMQKKLGKVTSYQDGIVGRRMISADMQCTLIQVTLDTPLLAVGTVTTVESTEHSIRAKLVEQLGKSQNKALKLYFTGSAGIGRDLTKTSGDSLESTTLATIILVIVVLMFVYRAPLLALIPLVTIAISVWVALKMLAIMTLTGIPLVNISKIFAIVILYGAGTDYCLFLISRYREELTDGHETLEALARSVGGVGEALAASAGTVMVGLGLMALAEFAKVRYAGPAIALSLGVALVASLTLTPALLRIMGKTVFWPTAPPVPAPTKLLVPRLKFGANHEAGIWERVSRGVARHPVKVWFASLAVLLPLVYIGLQVKPSYRATSELSPQCQSLHGLACIQRHFTAGEVGPVTVLLAAPVDWNSREGRIEIDHLSRGFAALPNVAEVRSLTQPMGCPLPNPQPIDEPETTIQQLYNYVQPMLQLLVEQIRRESSGHFVAEVKDDAESEQGRSQKYVTRLDVVLRSDPFDLRSVETLRLIKAWLKTELPVSNLMNCDVQSECFGITASSDDLANLTEGDRGRVNLLVLAAIFAILLLLVRRLWLAVYLLVTVLASYYAALGATVLASVFWTGAVAWSLDWRVPFFLFTILVAVGEDYNILLVSRALEEQKRFGLVEGMRRALAKTGGAITSCGLIMAGTFATLMLAGLGSLLQIGFALAFGVLIDTFLVRPFLVPAFAIMCWKAGAPGPVAVPTVTGPVLAQTEPVEVIEKVKVLAETAQAA